MLLLFTAIVAALWVTILSPGAGTADVEVPNLVGRTYQDISTDPSLKFELEIVEQRHDSTYEEGVVIEQDPRVGKMVKEGSRIELVLSLGKRVETMPNYINWDYIDAERDMRELMEKTVSVTYVYEPSETVAQNKIIRTDPIAGQTITEGQMITFVVSQGTRTDTVKMPNLFGMTEEQARSTLTGYGLNVGIVDYEESDAYAPGIVIGQSMQADVEVPQGMTVNITLSKAVETTPPETEPPMEPVTEPPTEPVTEPPVDTTVETTNTGSGEPPLTSTVTDTTEPPVESYVDWTLMLPQGVEYPEQFLLEIYVDDIVMYSETVEKTDGAVTLRIRGTGTVRVDAYIDMTLYKSESIVIS